MPRKQKPDSKNQDFAVNETRSAVVKNLRRIWESKKLEIQFTQVTAAKELGWSQGAISHYLNAITELNPAAIIKLANFLDVDPRDIDPDIEPSLPSVLTIAIKYSAKDMTKPLSKALSDRTLASSFTVEIPNEPSYEEFYKGASTLNGMKCYARLCKTSDKKHPNMFAVRLKSKKSLSFYTPETLPDSKKLHALWSVVSISYF